MPLSKEESKEKFTYEDYTSWPDDERWELIGGTAYNMTPAPSTNHQRISGIFYYILMDKLKGKACTPFIAPTDVVFSEHDVVQPDVFVVCDKNKITDKNIQGAPDLVVEVLSPSTALKDTREKKWLYEKNGVKEYISINPIERNVKKFVLKDSNRYSAGTTYTSDKTITLLSLNKIKVSISEIFEDLK